MKIFSKENLKELTNIINLKAKYQKVMLLYDDTVSNLLIGNIYNLIKSNCIYNQSNINNIDYNELNNGYKLIIYLCATDNFLKLDFDRDEFINVFISTDGCVLPYCLGVNNSVDIKNCYLFLQENAIDIALSSSMCFSTFYNHIKGILNLENNNINFDFSQNFINQNNLINNLEMMQDFEFVDMDILKKTKIEYRYLNIIDLMLIDAFLVLITSIKNNTLSYVDVYKACKQDYDLLNKLYSMANNESFKTLVLINYNCLKSLCLKTKEKILNFCVCEITEQEVDGILIKLKEYSKNCNNVLSYFYLYNIFY